MTVLSIIPLILLTQTTSGALPYTKNEINKGKVDDAQWGQWFQWSACTEQLDGTVQRRSRICNEDRCDGTDEEQRLCTKYVSRQFFEGALKSQWGEWNEYGPCSASCGGGFQTRTRLCYEKYPGSSCEGPSTEQRPCNPQSCCEWTSWTVWSQCTVTCGEGGYRYRTRQCTCEKCPKGEASQQSLCVTIVPCKPRKRICTVQIFRGFPLRIC